jgi:hypothetical protein
MLYINTDKETIIYGIDKKLSEYEQKLTLLNKVLQGLEKVKHHKTITKKLTSAIDAYCSLNCKYSNKILKCHIEKRMYDQSAPDKHGVQITNYYENTDEHIYFNTYEELEKNITERIQNINEATEQLEKEKTEIDLLLYRATELQKLTNELENSTSYTTRKLLDLTN